MFNLIKSELYKLRFDRILLILVVMILAVGINNFGLQTVSNGREAFTANTKDFVTLFACAAYAGMTIGGDFMKRTIHKLVMAGHSRISILISKLFSYFVGCTILYVTSTIFITIPPVLASGWGVAFTAGEFRMVIGTMLLSIMFHLCTATIPFLIAVGIKETGIATAVCLFIMMVLVLAMNNSGTADNVVAYAVSSGTSLDTGIISQVVTMSLIELFGGTIITYLLFRRVELK